MRRKLSKQLMKQYILQNDSTYIFISILFLMGVIFGAIFVNSLSITQKEDLFYYLNQFFHQITNENMMNKTEVFKISFWQNVQLLGLIWILGISIIGFPIVFILLFLKGIVIGFTVGFLVSEMGLSGVGLVFGSIFPQNILFIPIYIFIAAASVGFSMKLIRKIFIRQSLVPKFAPILSQYMMFYLVAVVIILIAACIESYVSTYFMRNIVMIINKSVS